MSAALPPIDTAMAHFAALDALRAGGDAAAAVKAAGDAMRPGGVLDWLERPLALRCAALAIEQHAAEEAANRRARLRSIAAPFRQYRAIIAKGSDR